MHPPPEPGIPGNVVRYGSEDGWLEQAQAAVNASEAGYVWLYFDMKGYDFAATLFEYYLEDHGPDARYVLNSDQVAKVIDTDDVRLKVSDGLEYILDSAREDPSIGATREITTEWMLAFPTEKPDVVNALAHFSIALGSNTTVTKAGSGLMCKIEYVIYIYDYYNFDQTRKFDISDLKYSFKTNVDADMRQLEAAGWARSYRVSGDTSNVPLVWQGDL